MATSSKVKFHLDTLKEKALESIDVLIANKAREVNSYEDDTAMAQRVADWRKDQEARISDLFRRLSDDTGIDDHSLSKWKIQPIPEVSTYERQRAVRDLQMLENRKSQIIAKSDSLVGDEDGNIALTKTQLAEFFGL